MTQVAFEEPCSLSKPSKVEQRLEMTMLIKCNCYTDEKLLFLPRKMSSLAYKTAESERIDHRT